MMGPERFIRNGIPDLRDNFPQKEAPESASRAIENLEDGIPFLERVFPDAVRDSLQKESAAYESGTYRARMAVGNTEQGTRHPHDYILEKEGEKSTFYFVDPEHQMGMSKRKLAIPREGDFRPKVSTLIGLSISPDKKIPDISMLRFRSAAIENPHLLKMEPQLDMIRALLKSGSIPEALEGKENEITFRMDLREDAFSLQSRYARKAEIERFLRGEQSALALEGKLQSFGVIMGHFQRYLRERRFTSRDASQIQMAA